MMRVIILGTRKSVLTALLKQANLLEASTNEISVPLAKNMDECRAAATKDSLDKLRGDWNGRRK